MNLETILGAVLQIGSNLPAFKTLFDEVKQTFSEDDQATLQSTYDTALAQAAAAHAAAQAL